MTRIKNFPPVRRRHFNAFRMRFFNFRSPSHSCESRNLFARQRKRFAFGERDSGSRVREDKLSPEWRFFVFSDTAKFGIVRKDKKHRHSGESRNLFNSIPAKAGISTPKAIIVQLPAASRRRRFLPSQEWEGLFPLIPQEWDGGGGFCSPGRVSAAFLRLCSENCGRIWYYGGGI